MTDGYEIDLDRAPQIIANLKRAEEQLQLARVDAEQLAYHTLSGTDSVSAHATEQFKMLALNSDSGSLFKAIDAYADVLSKKIASLEDMLAEYMSQEEINGLALSIDDAESFELTSPPVPPAGPNIAI